MSDQLYDQGERYVHLNSAGTHVIKTTETLLSRVVVNTFSAGGAISMYNSTAAVAGQLMSLITSAVAGSQGPYEYGVVLSGGLTVVLTNTPDITIVYK